METKSKQMTVAKCGEIELDAVRTYLSDLQEVLKDNACYDEDDEEVNKEIADVARKYPDRAFIVPLNLGILLDNYQDKDSDILKHPKWIIEMIGLIEDIGTIIDEDKSIQIEKGSMMDKRIKKILKED